MYYFNLIQDSFWNIATNFVPLIVPVLAVILLMKIINGIFYR